MQKFISFLKSKGFFIVLLFLISIPADLPVLRNDFFSIHDETHMVDLYEMFRALATQGFPPRWAPDLNFSLGHPYFNFYYHLPFYITSVFMFLGFSMIQSFKNFIFLSIISSIIGFYFFTREYFSKTSAILASTLYLYTPYFAVDLYVRGAVGELAVFALLPWAAFSITRLMRQTTLLRFITTAITVGLLGIAHNVLNIFIFPLLASYGLFLARGENFKKKTAILILAIIFGLGLSAYYILPALIERQDISNYEQVKIEDQFPFIKQLLIPHWGYGTSHWGPNDDLSFQIGIMNLIALVLAVIFLFKTKKSIAAFFIIVFIVSVILMNSRTLPFWNLHPVLRTFQFPWRLLIFTTISTSFLFGFVSENLLARIDRKKITIFGSVGVICTILLTGWYFRPSEYKQINDERYLELYFANRTLKGNGERVGLSLKYLNFSEDFIPPTRWALKRPKDLPKSLVEPKNKAKISVTKKGLDYLINISSEKENFLKIYLTYFPGWTALVDGQIKPIFPVTNFGIIGLNIPGGNHVIKLIFKNTPIRLIANLVSLGSGLVVILLVIKALFDVKVRKK